MAVPASGNAITMRGIFSEKNENDYSAQNLDGESNISLRGLSSNSHSDTSTGGNINLATDSAANAPNQTAPYSMSEFYGYDHDAVSAAFPSGTVDSFNWFGTNPGNAFSQEAPVATWGNVSRTGSETSVQVSCQVGFKKDTGNDRIIMQEGNGNSGSGTSLNLHYLSYTGHGSTTFQAKCTYTTPAGGSTSGVTKQSPASYSPASGTYTNISTSSFSPLWFWSITNTGFSPATIQSSSPHPLWHVRAGTTNSATTIDGPGTGNAIYLAAQRGTGGGFGGGGGGDFCVHEDHKISTADGLKTIQEVIDTCPKVWSWNNTTQEKELVDIASIRKVKHDNLYKINNMKVTDDHALYKENYTPVSVNPTKAKENYDIDSTEIQVGDKLMKFDGTLEEVTSIAVFDGEHMTYTILNKNGNFYAEEYLVDTEIKEAKYY